MRLPLALFVLGALCACGPYRSTRAIADADGELATARAAGADRNAAYEYTAAVEYLHKAREVGGYARYHEAIQWGQKAREFGHEATKLSRERAANPASYPLTGDAVNVGDKRE